MKHFLLEGEHIVPFEQRAPELTAAHRQFLQQGYDNGRFLLSGPTIGRNSTSPRGITGRIERVLGRRTLLQSKGDAFQQNHEFDPVQHQSILKDWFGKR